ncbi:HNH endonuclease [uncultured Cedecea sp.]|uniref:HNH endonuclease n=1 Tax=uncultured Cedecea sp. TaxID=988762 RepID=UPI00262FF244|nr:HNH endonuclease [uncultured Cedecea sp.]
MNESLLLSLLTYHSETGLFTWNVSRGKARKGKVAGYEMANGYIGIFCNKKLFKAHRLAWFFSYGEMPANVIDHINRNKKDNRIENLRLATTAENLQNRGIQKRNKSGIKGVSKRIGRNSWDVSIGVNGKSVFLGSFKDIELADLVAREAREKYHGMFANHGGDRGVQDKASVASIS